VGRIVIRYQFCIVGYFSWLRARLYGTDCEEISILWFNLCCPSERFLD